MPGYTGYAYYKTSSTPDDMTTAIHNAMTAWNEANKETNVDVRHCSARKNGRKS